jgi:hypothetical protein
MLLGIRNRSSRSGLWVLAPTIDFFFFSLYLIPMFFFFVFCNYFPEEYQARAPKEFWGFLTICSDFIHRWIILLLGVYSLGIFLSGDIMYDDMNVHTGD